MNKKFRRINEAKLEYVQILDTEGHRKSQKLRGQVT